MRFENPKLKVVIIAALLLIAFLAMYLALSAGETHAPTQTSTASALAKNQLRVGSKTISVEMAQTSSELRQGLSDRESLEQSSGMYFILGKRDFTTFWMKDMHFPLDIIWIDGDKIVGIVKNAPVPTTGNIPTFPSPEKVTNVLEVNAGFTQTNNITVGDLVKMEN